MLYLTSFSLCTGVYSVLREQGWKRRVLTFAKIAKSKKQRRLAAKRLRKEQALNPGMLVPKVPLYEQTVDLESGDGSVEGAQRAMEARGELTKAMRKKRRADIKERNFLGGLR